MTKTIVIPEQCTHCAFVFRDEYHSMLLCGLFDRDISNYKKCPECEAQTKVEVKYKS